MDSRPASNILLRTAEGSCPPHDSDEDIRYNTKEQKCGIRHFKSFQLNLFREHLAKRNAPDDPIIEMAFDTCENKRETVFRLDVRPISKNQNTEREENRLLTYQKMTEKERSFCALLAAEAFYDYDYFSIYVPALKQRKKFLDRMIQCEFKANWKKPEVVFLTAKENGRTIAVAQLCSPDFTKPSDAEYLRAGWFSVLLGGGIKQVNAWQKIEKQASAPCHELKGRNWYLSLFTVARSESGKGIGSRFLQEKIIPFVREAGAETLSLFTNSESNCRFYEKNGFVRFDEKRFESSGKVLGSWSYRMEFQKQ